MVNNKQSVNEIIIKLKETVNLEENDDDGLIKLLDHLIEIFSTENSDEQSITIDDEFLNLLSNKSNVIIAKTCKVVAEAAKSENGRKICTHDDLVTRLISLLERDEEDILIQTCRALGNICYENVEGNKLVQNNGSLDIILKILKKVTDSVNDQSNPDLICVITGFLLNYLVDHPDLQREAIKLGLIEILYKILNTDKLSKDKKITKHVLLILEIFNDNEIEFLNEDMANVLVNIRNNESLEVTQMVLELLQGQAENDNVKTMLAKAGVCELLIGLLEEHGSEFMDDEAMRELVKLAGNLIVLIITGDESMNLLYADGDGFVYKKLVEWLETKKDDQDLRVSAVLAIGNFGRTDKHCELMVSQNVHKKLYKLLEDNNNPNEDDIRFQHALLSALRNLVISINNKKIMLSDGLIDILYSMINISSLPVVFKLLGTLRIVIDKQADAAISVGKNIDIIKFIIKWCDFEDYAGVNSEANRLIAWIIINSTNQQVIDNLINNGAIKYLVNMINSSHSLMQNEALLSLTIAISIQPELCKDQLIQSDVAQSLITFFQNVENLQISIVENSLTFLTVMAVTDTLRAHLYKPELVINFESTPSQTWKVSLKDKIETFLNLLNT